MRFAPILSLSFLSLVLGSPVSKAPLDANEQWKDNPQHTAKHNHTTHLSTGVRTAPGPLSTKAPSSPKTSNSTKATSKTWSTPSPKTSPSTSTNAASKRPNRFHKREDDDDRVLKDSTPNHDGNVPREWIHRTVGLVRPHGHLERDEASPLSAANEKVPRDPLKWHPLTTFYYHPYKERDEPTDNGNVPSMTGLATPLPTGVDDPSDHIERVAHIIELCETLHPEQMTADAIELCNSLYQPSEHDLSISARDITPDYFQQLVDWCDKVVKDHAKSAGIVNLICSAIVSPQSPLVTGTPSPILTATLSPLLTETLPPVLGSLASTLVPKKSHVPPTLPFISIAGHLTSAEKRMIPVALTTKYSPTTPTDAPTTTRKTKHHAESPTPDNKPSPHPVSMFPQTSDVNGPRYGDGVVPDDSLDTRPVVLQNPSPSATKVPKRQVNIPVLGGGTNDVPPDHFFGNENGGHGHSGSPNPTESPDECATDSPGANPHGGNPNGGNGAGEETPPVQSGGDGHGNGGGDDGRGNDGGNGNGGNFDGNGGGDDGHGNDGGNGNGGNFDGNGADSNDGSSNDGGSNDGGSNDGGSNDGDSFPGPTTPTADPTHSHHRTAKTSPAEFTSAGPAHTCLCSTDALTIIPASSTTTDSGEFTTESEGSGKPTKATGTASTKSSPTNGGGTGASGGGNPTSPGYGPSSTGDSGGTESSATGKPGGSGGLPPSSGYGHSSTGKPGGSNPTSSGYGPSSTKKPGGSNPTSSGSSPSSTGDSGGTDTSATGKPGGGGNPTSSGSSPSSTGDSGGTDTSATGKPGGGNPTSSGYGPSSTGKGGNGGDSTSSSKAGGGNGSKTTKAPSTTSSDDDTGPTGYYGYSY